MIRLNTSGKVVHHNPSVWCESDCEITLTNFAHPTITTGQHTNGPARVWIRPCDGSHDWMMSPYRSLWETVEWWSQCGIEAFLQTCKGDGDGSQ